MATIIFPGSFDPLTLGHTDIINRALGIFDKVVVAVLENAGKANLFSLQEREALIREEFAHAGQRIEVDSFSGLLVEFAQRKKTRLILRGLRAISDFDYEAQMALMNKSLSNEVETLFLMTQETYSYVSSSLVRQVASFGGDVGPLVPKGVNNALKKKFSKKG